MQRDKGEWKEVAVREMDEQTESERVKKEEAKNTDREIEKERKSEKERVEESEGIRRHFFFISGLFTLCII